MACIFLLTRLRLKTQIQYKLGLKQKVKNFNMPEIALKLKSNTN